MTIDYTKIPLGAKKSPLDSRDFRLARLVAQVNIFPDEFILQYNHEVKNQTMWNECVAYSTGLCMEMIKEQQTGLYQRVSTGFIYGNRTDTDWQGEGMFPSEALSHLLHDGVCSYDLLPNDGLYPDLKALVNTNRDALLKDASTRKISAYSRVYNVDEIRNALMQLKSPVTFIMEITQSFYYLNYYNPIFSPVSGNEQVLGLHELTIIGWTIVNGQRCFIVQNSYGKEWGLNGRFYIPFSIFDTNPYYLTELWSMSASVIPNPDPINPIYWRVQCGAFSLKTGAEQRARELSLLGYKSYLVQIGGLYKCQVGAFSIEQNARNLSAELKTKGMSNFIVHY